MSIRTKLKKDLLRLLDALLADELLTAWNHFAAQEGEYATTVVVTSSEFDEYFEDWEPSSLVSDLAPDFDFTGSDYFWVGNDGKIHGEWSILDTPIDTDLLADYILDREDWCYVDGIEQWLKDHGKEVL